MNATKKKKKKIKDNLTDRNVTVHFHERYHVHKFLFELLNVSHVAHLGLAYAWFTSGIILFIIKWRSCLMGISTSYMDCTLTAIN